jgi:carbon-monoxide dehydrogenase medium subunit
LQRGRRRRTVPIDAFFVDAYSTSREEDEILVEIKVPPLPARAAVAYETFRFYERPSANVAVMAVAGDEGGMELTVAFGAAAPTPTRLEPLQVDGRGDPERAAWEAVEKAGKAIDDLDLLEDFHGSQEYKRHLLRVLLRRAVISAMTEVRSRK